jgi:hypothetical protein
MPETSKPVQKQTSQLLCPSAPGHPGESVLIGVVTGKPDAPRVMPTEAAVEVTPELLSLASPVSPSEVFRFASACRGSACTHFRGTLASWRCAASPCYPK